MTLRNVFTYGNFELMIKMYANVGHKKSNPYLRNNEAFYDRSTYYNVPYWTPENPGNTWARIDSYETGFDVWEDNRSEEHTSELQSLMRIPHAVFCFNKK